MSQDAIGVYDSTLRLEETVVPSTNSVDLSRSIGADYVNRFSNETLNCAEVFHVNSKISGFSPIEVPADRSVLYKARDWFFRSCYALTEDDFVPEHASKVRLRYDALPPELAGFLQKIAFDPRMSGLLHGLNVLLLVRGTVVRVLPRRDFLWIERYLNAELMAQLQKAFYGQCERPDFERDTVLFITGSFWRYMKFYGARGYRMILMDCGELLHHLEANLDATRFENFYDSEIDDVLMLDGVEHSILAAVSIRNRIEGSVS